MSNSLPSFDEFSLADWLIFLENRHKQEMQLGLSRIKSVAERIGLLHFDCPVIMVAGTNGKGSTVAALESVYVTAGYQVGSYTSPHLLCFNERIRINKQFISDKKLCQAFCFLEKARGDTHLTYFETVTLAALWQFQQLSLDLIILEVGMGGRLDATNIVDCDLAIITTIDLDHQKSLGHTLNAIGKEKAGILRTTKPLVYADVTPPKSILDQAHHLHCPLFILDRDYFYTENGKTFIIKNLSNEFIELPRPEIHLNSATAAVIAASYLQDRLPVKYDDLSAAMATIKILGRKTVLEGAITTIFDVAHNPQAVRLLADFVRNYKKKRKVHAVFSALNDKELCKLISIMSVEVDYWYPALLNSKRAASRSDLNLAFERALKTVPQCFANPMLAYEGAMSVANQDDIIVVFGSFLTVSAVMPTDYE